MHNTISFIKNQEGEKVEDHAEIEQVLINHFQSMHQEPFQDRILAIDKITQNVPKLVTEEHNQLLLCPVSRLEVDIAMK